MSKKSKMSEMYRVNVPHISTSALWIFTCCIDKGQLSIKSPIAQGASAIQVKSVFWEWCGTAFVTYRETIARGPVKAKPICSRSHLPPDSKNNQDRCGRLGKIVLNPQARMETKLCQVLSDFLHLSAI